MHLLQLEKVAALFHFPGLHRKGPGLAARQEVRLKEAEAADQKEAANRDTFAEPTRCIIGGDGREV